MFHEIMHVIGICPDSVNHFSLASLINIPMTDIVDNYQSFKFKVQRLGIILQSFFVY